MIIVKKFGGSSVESIEKIQKIATHIAGEVNGTDQIVVIVSAMGRTTDELFSLAYQITSIPNQREMDMLVTAGERITMALLSLSLQQLGIDSISFTGSQSGILTDSSHGNAKILSVNPYRVFEELERGKVVIVAGFQGVSPQREITTLGRGGSDTTAVALACFLRAGMCEIFTDVCGVYTADPRIVPDAIKLDEISSEDMLYLALSGSKVLHSRAAEFSHKYHTPTKVRSSFVESPGTEIYSLSQRIERDKDMEETRVQAIAHKEKLAEYRIQLDNGIPTFTTEIFDMSVNDDVLHIFVEEKYTEKFEDELTEQDIELIYKDLLYTIINLSGYRINKDAQFFRELYQLLIDRCTEPFYINNQGIGVQIRVSQNEGLDIVRSLHEKFILGGTT
jgi:aspartate kinase